MNHQSALVTLLVAAVVVLMSLICGGVAGFLRRLDGASVPSSLTRAGAAFGACLSVSSVAISLLLSR
jgi:hypothetical protein